MSAEKQEVKEPPKPKTPEELYQDMTAAKRAYEEKKIYETYLLYQLAKRDYDNYYTDKRRTIKAV